MIRIIDESNVNYKRRIGIDRKEDSNQIWTWGNIW